MQNYQVHLTSPVSTSYRCQKAADSLDIDPERKSTHDFSVEAELDESYNVGIIVGSSGSGKTTLAREIWGQDAFVNLLKLDTPVLEQFPEDMNYDDCVALLTGVGLTSVPCWIRPAVTLSNGQRARAEIALHMARDADPIVIDEWTSVVDRTVAKVMSHAVQKFVRKTGKRVVLCSCHYDVIEWLNPDWIIDCNTETYTDRRLLRREFQRSEQLDFEIAPIGRNTWKNFSRYHYLSENLPGGHIETFGVFHDGNQIGFQCFANYVPWKMKDRHTPKKMHSNRTVVHPDYVGFGLGIRIINITSALMTANGFDVWAKYTSAPVARSIARYPKLWALREVRRQIAELVPGKNMKREGKFRQKVKVYSYQWVGGDDMDMAAGLP